MSEQKLSTKALHAGHDTSLTQGTRAFNSIIWAMEFGKYK